MSEDLKLIVGLGNPGAQYESTRHNLGYLVVQHLAKVFHLKFSKSSAIQGLFACGKVEETKTGLFLPTTFMNNSGVAVHKALGEKKVSIADTLIVTDDFNLDFGQLRLRDRGSAGGHNGLSSVIEHLKTDQIPRLRVGIGTPSNKDDIIGFVLEEFSRQERKHLLKVIEGAADCAIAWLKEGTVKAMSQFNKRKDYE